MNKVIKGGKIIEKELISLAPTYDAEDSDTIYKKYIDETLLEKEYKNSRKYKNKNIAISGGYGAGKSSILNTYFRTAKINNELLKDKVLFVSLGSYIENKDDKLDEKEKMAVEVSILQQIIYSVSPEQIPFSRISRKDHDLGTIHFWSVLIALLVTPLIVYLLKFIPETIDCIYTVRAIIGVFIFLLIWWGLFYVLNKFSFNLINFGNSNVKAEVKNDELSLLNKYIDELVYFFKNTNKEIIVFEDIDRLEECQKVFSKLKEINSIINTAIKDKTIRFIYCVGEDVFEDAEKKTKFFDAIIPIIPYLGTSTAREILAKEFNEKQKENFPSIEFITIGRFISNPRLAYEIINEYKVFKNNMVYTDKSMKIQLLYLMAYKVLYPIEFEQLQRNEGLLSYYLSLDFKDNYVKYLHEERIKKFRSELEALELKQKSLITSYVSEFIHRIESKYNIIDNSKALVYDCDNKYYFSLNDLLDNPFEVFKLKNDDIKLRIDNVEYSEDDIFDLYDKDDFFSYLESTNVETKIQKLKETISNECNYYINPDDIKFGKGEYIKSYSMNEDHPFFPKKLINDEKDAETKEENDETGDDKEIIVRSIQLNRFEQILVEKNIINLNTRKLISRKHNEILTANDDAVLTKIIDNQDLSFDISIDDPRKIISELGDFSFVNDSTAIPALYKELFSSSFSDSLSYLTAISNKWTNKKFKALKYVGEMNNINVLNYFKYDIDGIWFSLELIDSEENSELINYYIYQTIICGLVSKLKKDSEFYYTIEHKEDIIDYLEEKYDEIKDKFNLQNIIFKEEVLMNSKCNNMLSLIYNKKMFSKCLNHIEEISKVMNLNFDCNRIIESITSNSEEKIINEMLTNDISHTIRWIKSLNIIQENSEESLILFANENDLSEIQFKELLLNEKVTFNDITLLNPKYYNILKEIKKLNGTLANLRALFEANGKEIDENIAEFMTTNKEKFVQEDFSGDLYEDFRQKFVKCDLFDNEVFADLNKSVMKSRCYTIVIDLPIDNLKILIKQGKMILKTRDQYEKILFNEELSLEEKSKVLADGIANLKNINIPNLDSNIVTQLLNSNISSQNKADFMLNNTEYICGVNKDLLFEIMLKEKIDFEVEGILNMLDISKSDNKKIKFYLMYKDDLLEVYEINDILQQMGGKFIRILNKENQTYLDNTIDNRNFIDHLIDNGFAERQRPTKNMIQIVFGNTR